MKIEHNLLWITLFLLFYLNVGRYGFAYHFVWCCTCHREKHFHLRKVENRDTLIRMSNTSHGNALAIHWFGCKFSRFPTSIQNNDLINWYSVCVPETYTPQTLRDISRLCTREVKAVFPSKLPLSDGNERRKQAKRDALFYALKICIRLCRHVRHRQLLGLSFAYSSLTRHLLSYDWND